MGVCTSGWRSLCVRDMLMKLSEEMREVVIEQSQHFSPEARLAVMGWIRRVEKLERGRLGNLWYEFMCYFEDLLTTIGLYR